MIRLPGFARKSRRLTKGGSLPAARGEVNAGDGESSSDTEQKINMGNNGHNGANGIEASYRNAVAGNRSNTMRHVAETEAAKGRNGDSLTVYLHRVVEDLLDPQVPVEGRPPLDRIDSESESASTLETVFARVSDPALSSCVPTWKRVFDVTCILLTLPVWLPLLLLVMAWIKLVSPGTIFYRQERVGYRGGIFQIFKFRTMHVNAETRSHEEYFARLMTTDCPMTKLDRMDDARLIRCGRLLRATGLDELPQLFNVLRGEMSLVGPRPCLPNEFQRYNSMQRQRVNAPPGLTGYWQVNGKNKTTFSEMIAMDMFYCEHMSVWLDIWILARTAPALITQTLESGSPATVEPEVAPVPARGLNGATRKI
jgi:lipopolysaccharide/colanic/teichoic acid biosynthesis glycosyltransferase